MSIWNCALEYLESGLSVFPIRKGDKRPYPGFPWEEFQRRLPSEDELDTWEDKYPGANLAVVTGKISGISVLDLDSPDAIKWAEERFGRPGVYQKTGREEGGEHWFFKTPRGGLKSSKPRSKVEVKGEGGYIVIAPSIHKSGRNYVLNKLIEWDELPEFPDLTQKEQKKLEVDLSGSLVTDAGKVEVGERNDLLAKLAGKLFYDGASLEEVKAALLEKNWNDFDPPLSDDEVKVIAHSINKTHERRQERMRKEVGVDDDTSLAFVIQSDPPPQPYLVKGLLPKVRTGVVAAEGGTGKGYFALQLALSIASGEDFFGYEVLDPGPVLILNAEDDRQIAWIRMKAILRATNISFQEAEKAVKNIHFPDIFRANTQIFPNDGGMLGLIEQMAERIKPKLIIIDPISKFFMGDHNSQSEASAFVGLVDRLSDKTGAMCQLFAHNNKDSMKAGSKAKQKSPSIMGSVAIPNSARHVITISAFDDSEGMKFGLTPRDAFDHVTVSVAKSNYSRSGQQIVLYRNPEGEKAGAFELADLQRERGPQSIGLDLIKTIPEIARTKTACSAALKKAGLSKSDIEECIYQASHFGLL
jgi:RecA-family ATPase